MKVHRLDNQMTKKEVSLNDFLNGQTPITKDTIDDMFSEDTGVTIRK